MQTTRGYTVKILNQTGTKDIKEILLQNRPFSNQENFFEPTIKNLHDPFLLPDMEICVQRILSARENKERIVIFGDYDVDGVSSTAILVRYLTEIGCEVSYRLPHRVHDGYGLKKYFFDELREKNVKLVITVDCGTRDIEPIRHAKSLGIDVIVTDHHAVPDIVPEEVIGIINPKRKDSQYPFVDLAGAGVAFKLVHAIHFTINPSPKGEGNYNNSLSLKKKEHGDEVLMRYIDFAALGTVSDCMPIIGENRIITTLGLRQMQESKSHGLRKFLEGREKIRENDADLIGFQIGPRINAAGRMDNPNIALQWLLASNEKCDSFFEELEYLNENRKKTTEEHLQNALKNIDLSAPIIFYDATDLEHGIIGLVAGKLTEMYGKPSIIIKNGHDHPLTRRKGDEVEVDESQLGNFDNLSIASCRSPEWCNIIEILDAAQDVFIRYGGHKQAAGFSIETSRINELKERLIKKFCSMHDEHNLPKRILPIECKLDMKTDITLANTYVIDSFRPFGIGNTKPAFLLEDETICDIRELGKEGKHIEIRLVSNPKIKIIGWGWGKNGEMEHSFALGDVISLVVEIEKSTWKEQEMVTIFIKDLIHNESKKYL